MKTGTRTAAASWSWNEEAAARGDGADALALERARPLDERAQQARIAGAHDAVGRSGGDALVEHGKVERLRVADVPRDPGEAGVENENADASAVHVPAALDPHGGTSVS